MQRNVLHVVSVSFSLPYFVGEQFLYFKKNNPEYNFFVACSPSENLTKLSNSLEFKKIPLIINRSISPIQDIKSIFKLRKIILENKIDVVIGHTPKGGMIAMIASYLARIQNRVYFRHGIMFETSTGFKKFLLKNIERITGSLANKVVCVSNEIKLISEKEKLNSKTKNIILGRGTCNGVDCYGKYNRNNKEQLVSDLRKKNGINEKDFVIGYVGRLVKDKGINDLIEAWELIIKKYSNVKLLLVGPFEDRDKVNDLVHNKIIEYDSIIHTDYVEDTSDYYYIMDAFILPSYREGFPTVVLEASSMELPILTTRATGCSESIIENVTGIFFDIEKNKIADAISSIIENPIHAKKMGIKGREFVISNFEQKEIWDIIEKEILTA
jgi:glycosyltransferase involved in cell wall biosynthesis